MIVVCEKSGTRERCPTCDHSGNHTHTWGCDGGVCHPTIKIVDGDGIERDIAPNYNCIEVKEVDI
jgi:hypothetical protein